MPPRPGLAEWDGDQTPAGRFTFGEASGWSGDGKAGHRGKETSRRGPASCARPRRSDVAGTDLAAERARVGRSGQVTKRRSAGHRGVVGMSDRLSDARAAEVTQFVTTCRATSRPGRCNGKMALPRKTS